MKSYSIIEDRKIRIAIVGCAGIANSHFNAIEKQSNDLELRAVCDSNPYILKEVSNKYNVAGYASLKLMLAKEELDIVGICTPSGMHSEQAIEIASHGVNVISEKPMATRWHDGVKMVKTCDKAGVRLFVVKQIRGSQTLQLLKRVIDENRFGRIYMVNMNVFWTRPQEYYDQSKWRGTWEMDGGAFMNQASHYVDLADWLFGPVEKVYAMMATLAREIEVEDTGVLNIKWRNGAIGSVNVTMLTYPRNFESSITVVGEKGTVRIGGLAANQIQHWVFADQRNYDSQVQQINRNTSSIGGIGHSFYYANVIDVLRGKAQPETDGREGLKSLEILIAAYLSARDNKSVSLPLEY